MEHVVFFPAPDGSPAHRRLSSLDEAVSFVEHLRNERDVQDATVHALSPVQLAFRTVYRVEVAGAEAAVPAPADSSPEPVAEVVEPVEPVEPVVEPVAEVAEPVAEPVAEEAAEEPAQETAEPVAESSSDEPVAANASGEVHSLGFFASN